MRHFSLQLKITLFLLTLFVIALVNTSVVYLLDNDNEKRVELINHNYQQVLMVEKLLSHMKDSETGQRGYLITHDTKYLDPYYRGISDARRTLKEMYRLFSDRENFINKLKTVEDLMEKKFAEMALTIQLLDEGKRNESINIVMNDEGKMLMDEIRAVLSDLLSLTKRQLSREQEEYVVRQVQLKSLMIFMVLLFIIMAILTFLFLKKNLFQPFGILVNTAHKTEKGEKVDIQDVLPEDEMGYLISIFYRMNQAVIERTRSLSIKAHYDQLTRLKNRHALEIDLPNTLSEAEKNNTLVALCFFDLNKFKPINDQFGHDIGDMLLIEAAKRIKSITRNHDDIYRIGGDEFIMVIKGVNNRSEVESFVERLFLAFESPIAVKNKEINIIFSLGIALYPEDAKEIDTLIRCADIAMYHAKSISHQKGISHYCFYHSDMEKTDQSTNVDKSKSTVVKNEGDG